jgi:hypothetical protein
MWQKATYEMSVCVYKAREKVKQVDNTTTKQKNLLLLVGLHEV